MGALKISGGIFRLSEGLFESSECINSSQNLHRCVLKNNSGKSAGLNNILKVRLKSYEVDSVITKRIAFKTSVPSSTNFFTIQSSHLLNKLE